MDFIHCNVVAMVIFVFKFPRYVLLIHLMRESEHCLLLLHSMFRAVFSSSFSIEITKKLTFSSHPHFEAFLKSTMLTLVSVVLVNRTVFVPSALVCQISSHGTFKKAFAAYKKKIKV